MFTPSRHVTDSQPITSRPPATSVTVRPITSPPSATSVTTDIQPRQPLLPRHRQAANHKSGASNTCSAVTSCSGAASPFMKGRKLKLKEKFESVSSNSGFDR